jgi:hypothetical protein
VHHFHSSFPITLHFHFLFLNLISMSIDCTAISRNCKSVTLSSSFLHLLGVSCQSKCLSVSDKRVSRYLHFMFFPRRAEPRLTTRQDKVHPILELVKPYNLCSSAYCRAQHMTYRTKRFILNRFGMWKTAANRMCTDGSYMSRHIKTDFPIKCA